MADENTQKWVKLLTHDDLSEAQLGDKLRSTLRGVSPVLLIGLENRELYAIFLLHAKLNSGSHAGQAREIPSRTRKFMYNRENSKINW